MSFPLTLTFNDVLMVPQYSEITSRSMVDISVNLGKGFVFNLPFTPANMANITGFDMAWKFYTLKGLALLHRFDEIEERINIVKKLREKAGSDDIFNYIGISIGVKENDKEELKRFIDLGIKIVCIDVAHLHSKLGMDMIRYVNKTYPNILLIAGTIATGEAAKMAWEAGADSVRVNLGNGCFAAGTRILMANGTYKNIEDILPNEMVINMNGEPVKVIKSFYSGEKKVSKFRNDLFYKDTISTPDHKYFVGNFDATNSEWKYLHDSTQDVLLMPNKINFQMPKTFAILLSEKNKNKIFYEKDCEITPSYNSGYLFGTLLGDNCAVINNGVGIDWQFGKHEKHMIDKLSDAIYSIFKKRPVIGDEGSIYSLWLNYKPLADFIRYWGKGKNKKLPEAYLVDNKEYLQGLFDGLTDSDGHRSKNGNINFTNSSPYLIELYNVVSYKLTGMMPNNKEGNGGRSYTSENLKHQKSKLTKKYQVAKLSEYNLTQEIVPVYDLEVDCDTHSFIANNAIVHNSICTTRIASGVGVSQLSALIDVVNAKKEEKGKYPNRKITLISDGGKSTPGDFCKALAIGADMCMSGNYFSATDETPGDIVEVDGIKYKQYNGSSTHKSSRIEGVKALKKYKGSIDPLIQNLKEGIQSCCSYNNAINLDRLKENAKFIQITHSGLVESGSHNLDKIL